MSSDVKLFQDIIDRADAAMLSLAREEKSMVTIDGTTYTRANTDRLIRLRDYYTTRVNEWNAKNGKQNNIVWRG